MAFEAFIEAIMQERPKAFAHAMRAADLGTRITIVKRPYAGCPYCFAEKSTMAVHEFGVQWSCGCSRAIDPIHRTPEERHQCKKCNSIEESNVIPIKRSA
jgi:hypothetical protein